MDTTKNSTVIASVTLEVPDTAAAEAFYAAFGVGARVNLRAGETPSTGFRAYTLSLVVSQPNIVDAFLDDALAAGATSLKPAKKGFWGYGGVVQAPDGAIWKVATSSKKNSGPATKEIDDVVLLLGVEDVKATKQFYVDHGLSVGKSFGSKYVEFESPSGQVKLALYGRRAAAKDAGVSPDGSGSHRIAIASAIASEAGPFIDLDGFVWETAAR